VLGKTAPVGPVTEPIDRGMLQRLSTLVADATRHLDEYDYSAALRDTEAFFWWFCDDYIELVKRRRSGDDAGAGSANAAAQLALSVMLRLFAPYLPFTTEEVWSWWQKGSVHRGTWPACAEMDALAGAGADASSALQHASEITALIRTARSNAKLGFSTAIRLQLSLGDERTTFWPAIKNDVLAGNNVGDCTVAFQAEPESATVEPMPSAGA